MGLGVFLSGYSTFIMGRITWAISSEYVYQ